MPEPFKNVFNLVSISELSDSIKNHYDDFDSKAFVALATLDLEHLEMKERNSQIVRALTQHLPTDFEKSASILLNILSSKLDAAGLGQGNKARQKDGLEGWIVAPLGEYIARSGQSYFELSMKCLEAFTMRFSSEFAIRYFLKQQTDKTLNQLLIWTSHPNHHVRRLASEGSRTRLPWGMRLDVFIDSPELILPILDKLKDDPSEYVRRSVANSLNDIAKDHPDLVSNIAENWLKSASTNRQRLVKHACRTLFKNGHRDTLSVFGFHPPQLKLCLLKLKSDQIKLGGQLEIEIELEVPVEQQLMIDYAIYHKKANGVLSPKVFKWKTTRLSANRSQTFIKSHSFKKVTTRAYYAGTHKVQILINGKSVAEAEFELQINKDA